MATTMQELLDVYYGGLGVKRGWETTIADDFVFFGNGGGAAEPRARSREGYAAVIDRFSKVFESVHLKDTVATGERAYALATYELVSPKGKRTSFDIAEAWTAKNGKLATLTLYYDTAAFNAFMSA